MSTTRAISFDLWGTLIKSDPRFKPQRNAAIAAAYGVQMPAEDFSALLRTHDRRADDEAMRTGEDYGFHARIAPALREAGISDTDIDCRRTLRNISTTQRDLAMRYFPHLYDPQIEPLLDELSEHIPLAITSNTGMLDGALMTDLLTQLGIFDFFCVHTFSNEVGASKPDPRIFAATYEGLLDHAESVRPEEIIHIGDNPLADGAGPTHSGMRSRLVNTSLPESQPIADTLRALIQEVSA